MKKIMIDLETLDTKPSATVLSVGAVEFDDNFKILGEFYAVFQIQEQFDLGRTVSQSTLYWWLKQNNFPMPKEVYATSDVLRDLSEFIGDSEVWANGTVFDMPILESLCQDFKVQLKYKFWNVRDLRTFMSLKRYRSFKVNSHNALEDCINQVMWLKETFNKKGLK